LVSEQNTMKIGDIYYKYVYIYARPHFSSAGPELNKMGGV